MDGRRRGLGPLAMGAVIYSLYAVMIYFLARDGLLLPSGVLATSVFSLEAAKLLAVLAVPRLRNASWQALYLFETVEITALPAAYGILVGLRGASAGADLVQFVLLYFASQVLLLPLFSIYRLARSMANGEGAGAVLLSSVLQFGLVSYFLELAAFVPRGPSGLAGLGALMLPSATTLVPSGSVGLAEGIVAVAGVLFYVVTITYVATDQGGPGITSRTVVLATLSTLLAGAWAIGWNVVSDGPAWLASGSFAMLLGVWWLARG